MFLSVSEMDVRKIRFDESLAPGKIDFSDEEPGAGNAFCAPWVRLSYCNTRMARFESRVDIR